MNHFEFYNIPVSLVVDEKTLKKIFYIKSKEFHPDFHTDATETDQADMLRLSALNNEAYNTLKDFDKRMKYILHLQSIIKPEDKDELPQTFLMEMMDINEQIMELQLEYEVSQYDELVAKVEAFEKEMRQDIEKIIPKVDPTIEELNLVKSYYYKKRYLRRMLENLEKISEN